MNTKLIILALGILVLFLGQSDSDDEEEKKDEKDANDTDEDEEPFKCFNCNSDDNPLCRILPDETTIEPMNCTTNMCAVLEVRSPKLLGGVTLTRSCSSGNESCTFKSNTPLCCTCNTTGCNMNNQCDYMLSAAFQTQFNCFATGAIAVVILAAALL